MSTKKVVVLGASDNPERYSNKAETLLKEKGYPVIPIHPDLKEIEGLPVIHSLGDIDDKECILTIYIGPKRVGSFIDDIVQLRPKGVIMNPGAESEELEQRLENENIPFVKECTLVLLNTGQFDKQFEGTD